MLSDRQKADHVLTDLIITNKPAHEAAFAITDILSDEQIADLAALHDEQLSKLPAYCR
jgi:hypothetical protein